MDSYDSYSSTDSDFEDIWSEESMYLTNMKGFEKGISQKSKMRRVSSESDSSVESIKIDGSLRISSDSAYSSHRESSPRTSERLSMGMKIEELSNTIKEKKSILKSKTAGLKPKRRANLEIEVKKLELEVKALRLKYEKKFQDDTENKENHKPLDDGKTAPKETEREQNAGPKLVVTKGMDSVTLDALKNLHESLKSCPAEKVLAKQPQGLKIPLMPHQRHGLAWMMWREEQTPPGGILADDMGLGKTLSMISLILKHKEDTGGKRNSEGSSQRKGGTLVVCPTSLLGQWKAEIEQHCEMFSLSLVVHHGTDRQAKKNGLLPYDIVLTTYGIIQRECKSIARKGQPTGKDGPVHMVNWTRIILDEAHIVRNYKSKTSQAISNLKGTYRWALTGTPIHNKELDIFALLVFLHCSPFDKYNVWCRWIDNKTVAGTQRMNMLMKSLMLRRTKEQLMAKGSLASLPSKEQHCELLDLDESEQVVYDKILFTSRNLFAKFLDQHAERKAEKLGFGESSNSLQPISKIWSKSLKQGKAATLKKLQANSEVKSHHIFVLLLRLRQICCHPALIHSMLEEDDYQNEGLVDEGGMEVDIVSQLNEISLVDEEEEEGELNPNKILKNPLTLSNPIFKKDRLSTKLKALMKCLEEIILNGKDKAIVVSQWTSMLDLIGIHLQKRRIKYCVLSGSVSLKDRMDVIHNINNNKEGPKILLLSLQAGGVGLNLVGANHLLLVDLHWNPQLEAQACDRIYRFGQKKGVHIYRFVCKHTVEQKIQELQEKKLSLADSVLTGAKNPHGNKLTMEDLKTLFSLKF